MRNAIKFSEMTQRNVLRKEGLSMSSELRRGDANEMPKVTSVHRILNRTPVKKPRSRATFSAKVSNV